MQSILHHTNSISVVYMNFSSNGPIKKAFHFPKHSILLCFIIKLRTVHSVPLETLEQDAQTLTPNPKLMGDMQIEYSANHFGKQYLLKLVE